MKIKMIYLILQGLLSLPASVLASDRTLTREKNITVYLSPRIILCNQRGNAFECSYDDVSLPPDYDVTIKLLPASGTPSIQGSASLDMQIRGKTSRWKFHLEEIDLSEGPYALFIVKGEIDDLPAVEQRLSWRGEVASLNELTLRTPPEWIDPSSFSTTELVIRLSISP